MIAGHVGPMAVGNLRTFSASHDLARAVDHVMHAAGRSRLAERQLAAYGIDREVAAVSQVPGSHEVEPGAFLAETRVLDAHEHRDRVAVVYRGHVHLARREASHREGLGRSLRDRRSDQVFGVCRCLVGDVLAEPLEPDWAVLSLTGQIGVHDQHASAAVAGHDDLELVYGIGDHRTVQDVLDRDRVAVEHCIRAGA